MKNGILIGARWDDSSQNHRFNCARALGLLDYAEVNYPISPAENPAEIGIPILAHTSNNALCSAHGIDMQVASLVCNGAAASNSPWVGEHLALLSPAGTGALGYVINPLFTKEFAAISVNNARQLSSIYHRPIALELGPLYTQPNGEYLSEMHFLGEIARAANTFIILDLTHWAVSNKNLQRSPTFGFEHLPHERVVELHIAGWRKSPGKNVWHDAHGQLLSEEVLELLATVAPRLPALQAVTLEQSIERSEDDFLLSLSRISTLVERHHGYKESA